ncbi:sugar kinase [Vibrio sp. 10N.261.51.A3]|uniref:sugar kinase n=1 Tax=Vibrio TaxID=662 RepID=UPI0002ECCF25|nr:MULTISPECIES: sugar kinase [Vibrio]OED82828.1 ketodeoxygluconokinase [Vibrio crassostreae ZF-91]PMO03774.1 ketodeoxygluconokinase [Vibrio sp. 10N.222.55.C12]PMO14461.1 ketodeoxygluconokinase [Vibrio sp. 10N.222.54.F10]PMO15274.1 ketodeoxygluconokinase [Vibrio sp. 10N.222.54.B6]TKF48156.1 sugar kinase [Vibrio sp. F13]
MKHIAIIGECMIELNGKPFGSMHQTFGGDTLNAAVYLSRGCEANLNQDDIKVSYVTALGADPISKGMLERWQQEGVSTDLVLQDSQRTPGLYLIQLDDAGERTFLYWRNQSAARYLLQHPDFNQIKQALRNVDMVFLSGITLAILPEQDRIELLNILVELKAQGVEIAFDSNFRPALWPQDENQTVKNSYQAMYTLTDLALVTFDDEQLIWGDSSPEQTIERLTTLGVKRCIVKLGADGCLIQDATIQSNIHPDSGAASAPLAVPTLPVDHVVDTTSAGDSFNGGFLSAYLAGEDLTKSCQRGNTMAGVVIQHRGAIIAKELTQAAITAI